MIEADTAESEAAAGLPPALRFLSGGGEATRLILARDWSGHPLGPPESWPEALKVALSLILNSPESMILAWGRADLTFFFNTTYIPLLGPRVAWAMGAPFTEVWADAWDQAKPIIDDAFAGRPERFVDLPWRLDTDRGARDTWWSFSYSRVLDAAGEIAGLFIFTNETTARVLADAAARESQEALRHETEKQRRSLQHMPGFAAVLSGPHHVYDYVNDAYVAIAGNRDFVGRPAREVFQEAEGRRFFELIDRIYASGEPFSGRALPAKLSGEAQTKFIDLIVQPIRGEDEEITGIFVGGYDVTEGVRVAQRRELLLTLDERLADVADTAELSLTASALLGEALGAVRVAYGVMDGEARTVTIEKSWNQPGYADVAGPYRFDDYGSHMDELLLGRIAVNADVTQDPRTAANAAAFQALGIAAHLDVPVMENGRAVADMFVHADRPRLWTDDEIALVHDVAQRTHAAIARRDAERLLRESEDRIRLATEAAEVGFWDVDLIHDTLTWPPRVKAMFGISADKPVSMRDFYAGLHPEDSAAVGAAFAAAADPKRRALYDVEYRTVGKEDGVVRWVAAKGRGLFDADGQCWRVIGTAIEITERKRTEAALAASQATLQAVYDNTPVGLIVAELPSGRLVEANRSLQAIFRHAMHRTDSVEDYGLWESYDADGRRTAARDYPLARTFATGEAAEGTYHFARGDGTRAWLRVQTAPIRDAAGAMSGGVVAVTDVDEIVRAREALETLTAGLEAEVAARTAELRQFRDIVEATTSPICAFDTDFRLIAFNKAHNDEFRRVNGFDTRLGDVFPDLFIPEQQAVMRSLMSRALTGERFTVTEEFGRPEYGQPLWEISYTPLRDATGTVIGAFHVATDISDRVRAEADLAAAQEALRQSQKMEAIGSLTGGVAHDFNNLLTPIVGALDMLGRKGLGGEREQRLIAGAAQSAERAKVLVQRLLAFARRQPLQPVAVDVATLVRGMADLVASTTGPQIKVVVDVADDLPPARTDPNQLEMALLNLAVNARDAMPDGGTLRISAAADVVGGGDKRDLRPGDYIRLSVADTGAGMDEATLARAIEPFFSTKGIGKGTGLGLSMVHGFASQLGGGLTIGSRPGLGTNVELWLPRTDKAPELAAAPPSPVPPPPRGTVLLVDDEDIVRLSTADMLADLGYDVVDAASAEEALRRLENDARIDLLITDHLMPGMTGTDLARAIAERRPNLPVLVVSGYADVDDVAPDLPRLTKPFRIDELAASLAGLSSTVNS